MAVGGAFLAVASNLIVLGLLLAATGLVSSPLLVVAYLATDELVPAGGRTEATTWVSTSMNAGLSLGAAGAGLLLDTGSPARALAAGAVAYAVTGLAVLLCGSRLQPVPD